MTVISRREGGDIEQWGWTGHDNGVDEQGGRCEDGQDMTDREQEEGEGVTASTASYTASTTWHRQTRRCGARKEK